MSDTTANAASATREAEELPKAQSPVRQFVKKFLRRKTAVIGFLFIVFILILAVIGPNITPYESQRVRLQRDFGWPFRQASVGY